MAMSQGDDQEELQPSTSADVAAIAADEWTELGLTKVDTASIVARRTYGRLRLVPAGGPIEWDSAFEPQADLQAGEVPLRDDLKAGLPTADGTPIELALPSGFHLVSAGSLAKRANSVQTFVSGAMVFAKEDGRRPITLGFWNLKSDAVVEVTAFAGATVWDMSSATRTTGFWQAVSPGAGFESVLQADFVVGNIYFQLKAPGTSPGELLGLVSAIRDELPK